MTRAEHIAWCKQRALEYIDHGDVANGVASMLSDLRKHEETRHAGHSMALIGMMYVAEQDPAGARRWVEGFR